MLKEKQKIKRRDFFKLAATSGAAVAVASCAKDPVEKLLPAVFPPDDYRAGVPMHFASICKECPMHCGVVVKTREARAIKIEGNPYHSTNQGKLCAIGQSSLQTLYNPNRIKKALVNKKEVALDEAKNTFYKKVEDLVASNKGNEILLLHSGGDSSLNQMITKIASSIKAKEMAISTSPTSSIQEANKILFGSYEVPDYHINKADFLLNFGADFLESWVNPLKFSREFTEFHAYKQKKKNEYIHISPHLSITGVRADEWITCPPKAEEAIALALVRELATETNSLSRREKNAILNYTKNHTIASISNRFSLEEEKLKKLAQKLRQRKSLVLGGGNINASGNQTGLQIAIALLNHLVGANKNGALSFGAQYQIGGNSFADFKKEISSKKYSLVILVDNNIDYILAKDPDWKKLQNEASFVSLSLTHNETTVGAEIVIPILSSFEDWGDSFVKKGIYATQQPVMAKLPGYDAESLGDLFLGLAKKITTNKNVTLDSKITSKASFLDYLKNNWRNLQTSLGKKGSFENFWRETLKQGGVFTDYKVTSPSLRLSNFKTPASFTNTKGLSLFAVNSNLQSSNGNTGDKYWLLEVPHPITQVVWDSWLEIHPEKAKELGIEHKDEVEVITNKGTAKLAAYLYPFIDKNTLVMPTGLGRTIPFPNYSSRRNMLVPFSKDDRKNVIKKKIGVNPLEILPLAYDNSGEILFSVDNVQVRKTGKKSLLVTSDGQYRDDIDSLQKDSYGDRSQKHRHLIQTVSTKELDSGKVKKEGHHFKERYYTTNTRDVSDFYKERRKGLDENIFGVKGNKTPAYYDPYKFEMTIDLNKCTGCSACVIACYAENNIAVVGKERQAVGREMSWLRIERYIEKDKKTGKKKAYLSPQMCQQCGNAGCEAVCPVYATYHNPDGLNAQIYNRCVGTRYCANNCVYKQRRFNWRTYNFPSPLHLQLNPDVSVRDKGVMEKCTFCVQRISAAKDKAKDENRVVFDGEIKTACQQTCPTDAIVFGNAMDEKSQVAKLKKDIRGYHQLEELNFQPSVTYLKKIQQS